MALRLHWAPDNASLPVRVALERFGLAHESVRVDRGAREQESPAYRALNPRGLIPVLEDDGDAVFETAAILLHLAGRAGRMGGEGPAADDASARPAFLSWMVCLSNGLHGDLVIGFRPERYVGDDGRATLLDRIRGRVVAHCDLIEARLAEGGMAAGRPTLLEDYLAALLRWAQLYPRSGGPVIDGLDPWPRIGAMLARLDDDPAVQAACRAEAVPLPRPFTAPRLPDLPAGSFTG